MPNRDAIWVMPDGRTAVVTVDEAGNLVQPEADPAPEVAPAEPIPAPPPAPTSRKRRRH